VDAVLIHCGHAGVPLADQLYVFIHLVGLDLVEDDRVDIFAASQHLGKGALDILVEMLAFLGAVDERG
jgi:hypothetical protein